MGRMKQRMGFFETTTQALAEQNNRLLDENRVLWSELVKSREKIEKKTDLITMILYSILTPTAMKLFKRMFQNTPAVFGDEGQGSKNPADQTALESTISLPNDKIFQVDYDKLKKVLSTMFQYSGSGENPFTNDPLLEGNNSFNTKANLFKNYVNILTERENFNKGVLSHPKKEILDQNDRKRFELTDHDHGFDKPSKIISKNNNPPCRSSKGNESFLKYNEEDDQMRDFLKKVQKKDPSANNMFNSTPRSDKAQNSFDALLPQKVKSDFEPSKIKKSDDRVEIYGSPLISSSPYRNPEFHDSFDLQNPSTHDNFDFKLPMSPGLDPMNGEYPIYNRFGPGNSNNTEKSENNQQDPFSDEQDMLEPMTIFSRMSSKFPESDKFLLNSPRVSPLKSPAPTSAKIERDDPFSPAQKTLQGFSSNNPSDQIMKKDKPVQLFLKN